MRCTWEAISAATLGSSGRLAQIDSDANLLGLTASTCSKAMMAMVSGNRVLAIQVMLGLVIKISSVEQLVG